MLIINRVFSRILPLLLIICSVPVTAKATNWYVRPSGGSGGGTSWTAAWNGLNGINWSSVAAGDTVCLAGGTYSSGTSVGKSGTSSSRITIRRAAASNSCSSGAGWNAAYDSQVVINGAGFSFSSVGSYVTIDGVVNSGIKINVGDGDAGFDFLGNATYVTLQYVEVQGPGAIVYSTECRGVDATPSSSGMSHLTVSHAILHGCPTLMQLASAHYTTIEYTTFYDSDAGNPNTWHPNVVYVGDSDYGIYRYNLMYNFSTEGLFFTTYGSGSGGPFDVGWKVYGNVFRDGGNGYPRGVESHQAGTWGPLYFYNNVFSNLSYAGLGLRGGATGEAYNNVFINASASFLSLSHDYNAADFALGEAHGISNLTSAAFANYSGKDFRLSSNSVLINKGKTLGSEFSLDMDGKTRGTDGSWDMGAFEFGSGSPPPPPAVPVNLRVVP